MNLPTFEFNAGAQALTALDRKHKFVLNFGGKGSGKTVTHALWALDRGSWDTGQLHGIFTNTEKQLKGAVFVELKKWLPRAGVGVDYGHRPPASWVREWARKDIPIPPITDYRGIWYTQQGLHAMCGTLFGNAWKQFESFEFASIRVEEVPAIEKVALDAIISRLRCGAGEEFCRANHRHQVHLYGNPVVGPHKWLYDWLDTWEDGAKRLYHAVDEPDQVCECGKEHGPRLEHRQWPLLRRGIGNAILIKSKTSDNRKNLSAGYEDDLAANYDATTARAWLGGEFIREVSGGCYSSDFSDANVRDVDYHPNRTIFVCIDINIEPRVAVLVQPLMPGEYPDDWQQPGVEQLGIVGEYVSLGGMSDHNFAEDFCDGGRGEGEAGYADEKLRGLPENWKGLEAHTGPIVFYGDADGNRRSAHDKETGSSWDIMMRVFRRRIVDKSGNPRFSVDVPQNNPPARARIHAVCGKLCNANGKHSLSIDPRCRHCIKDGEGVVWDTNGLSEREWRQGPERMRTHCFAALGYCVHRRSPHGAEVDDGTEEAATVLVGHETRRRGRTQYPG